MPRSRSYGQFCPVARAAEIVAERWTPLILRELMCGSRRFGDLRRGVPLMSPSLLSQRLKQLEDDGVVRRVVEVPKDAASPKGPAYELTEAGKALEPLIEALGLWGHRFIQRELSPEELDPALLMWDVRRCIDASRLPPEVRTVVFFELGGVPLNKSRWWLVIDRGQVDLCLRRPGYAVDLEVRSDVRTLVDIWLDRRSVEQALRGGELSLSGARPLVRGFARWFGPGTFTRLARERGVRPVFLD